jgi:hypothetical protein
MTFDVLGIMATFCGIILLIYSIATYGIFFKRNEWFPTARPNARIAFTLMTLSLAVTEYMLIVSAMRLAP